VINTKFMAFALTLILASVFTTDSHAGDCPFHKWKHNILTRGVFKDAKTGHILLRFDLKDSGSTSCQGLKCKSIPLIPPGEPTSNLSAFTSLIVIDPKTKGVYRLTDYYNDFCCGPVYTKQDHKLSTDLEIDSEELVPLKKLTPCPIEVSGGKLYYTGGGKRLVMAEKWAALEVSANCFAAADDELIIRYRKDSFKSDPLSKCYGQSRDYSGWAFTVLKIPN